MINLKSVCVLLSEENKRISKRCISTCLNEALGGNIYMLLVQKCDLVNGRVADRLKLIVLNVFASALLSLALMENERKTHSISLS